MTWKKFIIACFSVLCILLPVGFSNGCGGSFEEEYEGYYGSFFTPEVFGLEPYKPLFFSDHRLYDLNYYAYYEETANTSDQNIYYSTPGREQEITENLADWKRYFNNNPEEKDIRKLIYKTDSTALNELAFQLSKKGKRKKHKEENSLTTFLRKNRKIYSDLIPYLLYIRACSHYVTYDSYDWTWEGDDAVKKPVDKGVKMTELREVGLKNYRRASSDFMKLRYGFQVVRLAHYSGNDQLAIRYYDLLVAPLQINSPVKYWALAHKAGALSNLGDTENSLYQFAVVFANCNGRKVEAYQGFQQFGGGVCEMCLNLAKTPQEKTAIWLLKGLIYETTPTVLQAMEEIYKLDPKSEHLELLLSRELGKQEKQLFEAAEMSTNSDRHNNTEQTQIRKFVKEIAAKGNTLRPFVWHFGAGYLAYLNDDYNEANRYFENVKKLQPENKLLLNQIHLLEVVQKYEKLKIITPATENEIATDLKWLESSETAGLRNYRATRYVYDAVAELYRKAGDDIKYALITSGLGIKGDKDYSFYVNMVTYLRKPGASELETLLLKKYPFPIDFLLQSQATILISNYQFRDAAAVLKQVSSSGTDTLEADPFNSRIKDCHDCDYEDQSQKQYTTLAFVQRMNALQELVRKYPENADYHFLLGNAYYNLTYFGNSWNLAAFERNNSDIPKLENSGPSGKNKFNYYNTVSCQPAQKEYEAALRFAKNKELAAKAAFMAAKCEQNQYFVSPAFNNDYYSGADFKVPLTFRKHFKQLKHKYAGTRYYQEIIQECSYFGNFVVNDN